MLEDDVKHPDELNASYSITLSTEELAFESGGGRCRRHFCRLTARSMFRGANAGLPIPIRSSFAKFHKPLLRRHILESIRTRILAQDYGQSRPFLID
jgi:hypothetical protein